MEIQDFCLMSLSIIKYSCITLTVRNHFYTLYLSPPQIHCAEGKDISLYIFIVHYCSLFFTYDMEISQKKKHNNINVPELKGRLHMRKILKTRQYELASIHFPLHFLKETVGRQFIVPYTSFMPFTHVSHCQGSTVRFT